MLDNYLVVKLHEAMLDMKAQLQMMEAQVVSIARQKESLERTLQAKTQYIRVRTAFVCSFSYISTKCYQNTVVPHFLLLRLVVYIVCMWLWVMAA